MNEEAIADIWMVFKSYIGKQDIDAAADKFLDTVTDHGATEIDLIGAKGTCAVLDKIILEYIDDELEDL